MSLKKKNRSARRKNVDQGEAIRRRGEGEREEGEGFLSGGRKEGTERGGSDERCGGRSASAASAGATPGISSAARRQLSASGAVMH